jgi:ATP-binding cassette, subfamily B, bacterial MsbA
MSQLDRTESEARGGRAAPEERALYAKDERSWRPRLNPEVVRVYRRLLGYLRPHRLVMVGALLAGAGFAAVNGGFAPIMAAITERLQDPGSFQGGTVFLPVLIVVLFAIRGTLDFLAVYGLTWIGRSVIRDLRRELFGHYLGLPVSYHDQQPTGALISKLTYNTEQISEAISNAIVTVVRDTLTIFVLIGVMIYYSVQLFLMVVVIGPVVALLVDYMSKAFRRYSRRIQSSMGDVTRVTEQSLHGHRIVKVFEGQDYEQRQFDTINDKNFRLNVRLVATRAAGDFLTQLVVAAGAAAVIFVAFSDWVFQELNAPAFMGFLTAMAMILAPLKRLTNINVALQRGIAAADSVFETLDEPAERDTGGEPLERAKGDVDYRNVTFSYDRRKGRILNDISLRVPAGSTLALVGRSGSGKSTLVSLLPRFYDIEQGAILLDGKDIRSYRLRDLRRQVALVSQDVVLFDDTIANNIAYGGLARCSRADIERAAEAAYVAEFTAELPDGLDTQVGERGVLLSGGQRQRIAIARALLKDAPVLILDEATSALDTESERRIQGALGRLMEGRTTLVIAHRLSTVEKADQIVVMQDGAVVETGTHAELLARGGHYASLHRMQFAD